MLVRLVAGLEGTIPDAGNAVRDRDARQAAAVSEGIRPNAGDRFSFDSRRDSERTRYLFITVSDSDRLTFSFILQVIYRLNLSNRFNLMLLPTPPKKQGHCYNDQE